MLIFVLLKKEFICYNSKHFLNLIELSYKIAAFVQVFNRISENSKFHQTLLPNGDSSDFYQIPFMTEDKNSFDDSQKSEINETMKFVIFKK